MQKTWCWAVWRLAFEALARCIDSCTLLLKGGVALVVNSGLIGSCTHGKARCVTYSSGYNRIAGLMCISLCIDTNIDVHNQNHWMWIWMWINALTPQRYLS